MTTLSRRALNRALLRRQFLLERADLTALNVIGHLVAMQAQEPNWPYAGLWTRIRHFTHADLTPCSPRDEWCVPASCAARCTSPQPTTSCRAVIGPTYLRRAGALSTSLNSSTASPRPGLALGAMIVIGLSQLRYCVPRRA